MLLEDTEILAKLSAADMVALEAKYHTKCLVNFYNRARRARAKGYKGTDNKETISGIVFAELVLYIEETRQQDEESSLVFKLSDLSQLYISRMEQLGVKVDMRVHTTRLKERLLCEFTDMRPHKKGRDVLLAFEEDIGTALARACDFDSEVMPFTLPVLPRLYVIICLGELCLSMDLQQAVKKKPCHHCY